MSDELITWLRAQLDEDEEEVQSSRMLSEGHWALPAFLNDREYLMADIEAKRRILDEFDDVDAKAAEQLARAGRELPDPEAPMALVLQSQRSALLLAVRALALPYADRPGYLEEWRP